MTKNLLRYLPSLVFVAITALVAMEPASAQSTTALNRNDFTSLTISLFKPSGTSGIFTVLSIVINFFLFIAGLAAFFYILYGGFLYLTAGGDAAGATKGRTYIVNAIIGIIIIFISYALARFVIGFTNNAANGGFGTSTLFQ